MRAKPVNAKTEPLVSIKVKDTRANAHQGEFYSFLSQNFLNEFKMNFNFFSIDLRARIATKTLSTVKKLHAHPALHALTCHLDSTVNVHSI